MSEKDLNIKYICNKTLLAEKDELVPIILEMIQESYKSGLCQSEYDNTMGLIEENAELKLIIEEYERLNKENGRGFTITSVKQYNIDELIRCKNNWNILKDFIDTLWLDDKGIVTRIRDKIELIEQGSDNK